MNDSQSYIGVRDGRATSFVGPDAVNLVRAITLVSALRLYAKTGMLITRGAKIGVLLNIAKEYTGKTYKRGQAETAAADVQVWVEAMRAALPVVHGAQPRWATWPPGRLHPG